MRASIQTQAAYRHFRVLLSHGCKIAVAFARIVTLLARLRLPEKLPREGLHRADRHAFVASAAALPHRFPGHLERRIGKDAGPTDPQPQFGSHQQTALADPAQPGQMRRQLVGKRRTEPFVIIKIVEEGPMPIAVYLHNGSLRHGMIETPVIGMGKDDRYSHDDGCLLHIAAEKPQAPECFPEECPVGAY